MDFNSFWIIHRLILWKELENEWQILKRSQSIPIRIQNRKAKPHRWTLQEVTASNEGSFKVEIRPKERNKTATSAGWTLQDKPLFPKAIREGYLSFISWNNFNIGKNIVRMSASIPKRPWIISMWIVKCKWPDSFADCARPSVLFSKSLQSNRRYHR